MMRTFRLLKTIETDGAMQMAIDEAILTARKEGMVPDTLRFFLWKPVCLTIGYFQSLEKEVDVRKAKELGVGIVRRYTGGGAVLHEHELTYSLAVSESMVPEDIVESYRVICGGLVKGLECLGVAAEFKAINDIVVKGRKISGNAQTRKGGVVLSHGTLLLDVDVKKMFSLLIVPDEKIRDKMIESAKDRVTCLNDALGRVLGLDEVRDALIRGFGEVFDAKFEEGELTEYEVSLAKKLRAEKYGNPEWNYSR